MRVIVLRVQGLGSSKVVGLRASLHAEVCEVV